jgi:tRNA threonylcarbamoyladenosine biosynthesis protein TsaB
MRILSLDTTTDLATFGAADEVGVRSLLSFRQKMDISRRWPLCVQAVLQEAGWELDTLDGIGVCSGPGSFTGLRIGMVAAKTLAQALGLPVVALSSLDLLARPVLPLVTGALVAVLPCRKGEVYAARYLPAPCSPGMPQAEKTWVAHTELLLERAAQSPEPVAFVGNLGAGVEPPGGVTYLRRPGPEVELLPLLTVQRTLSGLGEDPLLVKPTYLKRSQAEEALEAAEAAARG